MATTTRKRYNPVRIFLGIRVFYPLLLFLLNISDSYADFNCTLAGVDLSPLDHTIWTAKSEDSDITYEISICRPLVSTGCHGSTSVCATMKNGTHISMSNITSSGLKGQENEDTGELWLMGAGDRCPEMPDENLTTAINFKCGPTLGSPKYIDYMACVTYFEWETSIYCKGIPVPTAEVQCSLYGRDGERYDLSPLALRTGGYLVDLENERSIYINVCRDIAKGTGPTSTCPSGAGACRLYHGAVLNLGTPIKGLKQTTDGRLMLHYTTNQSLPEQGCTIHPSTTITFKCPKRGGSKDPLLISDFNCEVVIEWETEYACPESKLTNDTCVLTKEDSDIAIDLTPLRKPEGTSNPYVVHVQNGEDSYDYYLNVCGGLNIPCPTNDKRSNVSACQLKPGNDDFGMIMGQIDHTTLRYADRELTLTYRNGTLCHHNKVKRSTIIKFQCNESAADDGRGYPEFSRADNDFCIYYFDWGTKYACVETPILEDCRVNYNNQRFDLSSLVRNTGTNWEALHETTDVDGGTGKYYINICHYILTDGEASGCDPRSSLCYKDGNTVRNLGHYTSKPTYNPTTKEITLEYINGDACNNNGRIASRIRFSCKPGNDETAPQLISVSPDKCQYEFEWQTASACVLGHYKGDNCKVYDTDAGFNFDLSPLKKDSGYTVTNDDTYNFLLNVCGPVSCTGSSVVNPGICQTKKDSSDSSSTHATGQWSDKLDYFDGMINLTYSNGDPYNDPSKTPRISEIAFLCDPSAGIGTPKYLKEEQHAYVFEWYTSYACPSAPVECAVTDPKTNQQYDLSSLAQPGDIGNWNVMANTDAGHVKYYINVCRALNPVPVGTGCDSFASVCRTIFEKNVVPEKIDISNMGQIKTGIEVVGNGHLKLAYVGPATCNNGTHNVTYITKLEFVCDKSTPLGSGPSAPRKDGPCEYTVLWTTAAACPLVDETDLIEKCSVKDPNSDYIYNLQPLKRSDDDIYTVTGEPDMNGVTFKINICGGVPETVCNKMEDGKQASACIILKNGTKISIGEINDKLSFSELGKTVLIYDGPRLGSGQRTNVHVEFKCSMDLDLGEPRFVGMWDNSYYFEVVTSLVCPPIPVDCFVQDSKGNQYDLDVLARFDYWNVTDTREGHSDLRYFINVCKPVFQVPGGCSAGPIGSCQKSNSGSSFNLGYIHSKPVAHDDQSVTIHYRNGDLCHKGTENESHRSTRINFFCSPIEGGPTFLDETPTCEYVFNWNTPAACPLQKSTGTNCKVEDPMYHYSFDLSTLRKTQGNYETSDGEYKYLLNVCGPLNGDNICAGTSNASSCQTKPGDDSFTDISAGISNSSLSYDQGEITLTYLGGRANCHGKYERQTIITFKCNQGKSGREPPVFLEETKNCQYRFLWETMYACPPVAIGPCATTDPSGRSYDLSNLALSNSYYETTDAALKKKFVFNVCTSVVFSKGALCPDGAAACMKDLENPVESTRYHNIGRPNAHQLQYDNNRLFLYYNHGELCSNGKDNVTTHILLQCDKNAFDTSPIGHFMVGDCDHHFLWSTQAACPISDQATVSPGTSNNCKLVSPRTGYEFDLSTLMSDKAWNITDSQGHLYMFNVCAPLKSTTCEGNSNQIGVCQSESTGEKRKFSAGNFNSNLQYNDGILFLNYTGGDSCHGGHFERNTIINFVCNEAAGTGHPVYIDETDGCTYYFAWHTSLVCEEHIKCTVDVPGEDVTLDLSPLSEVGESLSETETSEEHLYLSVCRPLTPVEGKLCPPGSSACSVKTGSKSMSLGKLNSPPTFESGVVTLQYVNGSQCDVDQTKKFSTSIKFTCQAGKGPGIPQLIKKIGCQYLFEWITDVTCYQSSHVTQPPNFCGYYDPQKGENVDLTILRAKEAYPVINGDHTYLINPCGPAKQNSSSACGHAMVCDTSSSPEISHGEPSGYVIDKEDNMLKMMYKSGSDQCSDGKPAQSHIMLQCDQNAGIGHPEFFYSTGCYVVFLWKTTVVCPRANCLIVDKGQLYDLNMLSRETGAWKAKDTDGNKYLLNVCGEAHQGIQCGDMAAVCRQKSDGQMDALGSSKSQKLSMDGDTIVLEYREGSPVCKKDRRRSDNDASRSVIKFSCGTGVGGPVYKSSSNSQECVFEFEWKTRLACRVQNKVVEDNNGVITDSRSSGQIDLNKFTSLSTDKHQTAVNSNGTVYQISLDGKGTSCTDGTVICAVTKTTQRTVLGSFGSRRYLLQDDNLEAEYKSTEKCPGQTSKTISSVIYFKCNKKNTTALPLLIENYQDCFYGFVWESDLVCIHPKEEIQPPSKGDNSASSSSGSPGNTKGGPKASTIAAIVSVFAVAILICILVIVFHKPERRAAFVSRVRKFAGHKSSEYVQLPTDTDELGIGEEDILNFEDPSEMEHNREDQPINVHVKPQSYHDDSDEDLLA